MTTPPPPFANVLPFDFPTSLRIDAEYRNTNNWKLPHDVFNKFFRFDDGGINNVAGFRPKSRAAGTTDICNSAFVVLVTNLDEPEWPDHLEKESGVFTYYGDNRQPGAITETPLGGNRLLERVFDLLHQGVRGQVQPFLAFQTVRRTDGSYMRFLGLICPGAFGVS